MSDNEDVVEPEEAVEAVEQVVSEPAEVASEPAEVASEPAEVASEPAEVVSEPAEVASEPAEVEEIVEVVEIIAEEEQKQAVAKVEEPADVEVSAEPKKKKKRKKHKKKKAKDIDPESSAGAWNTISVQRGTPKFNWYACKIKGKIGKSSKLVLANSGTGGANECSAYLQQQDDKILFGLILAISRDLSNSVRSKFIYFRFIGKNVSFMSKAKLTPSMGAIDDQFPTKHLTLELSEQCADVLTPEALSNQLLRIGGAHKPDSYDFGPGQSYDVS